MTIMRKSRPSRGHVGSTWPSASRGAPTSRPDPVEEAGDASVPCSDPPPWTRGRAGRAGTASPAPAVEEQSAALREVEVAAMSGLPDGEAYGIDVEGREIALCRRGEQVYALSGTCAYHPIPLRGATLEGEVLTCPWYGAQFDVRTGESVFLRLVRPLATYPTAVRGGKVFVQLPREPAPPPSSRWVGAER